MKKIFAYLVSALGFLPAVGCFAQQNQIDSLVLVLKKDKDDTNKVNALNLLAWEFKSRFTDTAIVLSGKALQLAQKNNWKKGIAISFHQLGVFNYFKSNLELSLSYYTNALELWKQVFPPEGGKWAAKTLSNIGGIYNQQSNYIIALDFYGKAIKIFEDLNDKKSCATVYGNVANIYNNQANYPKALEHYLKALTIAEEFQDKVAIARHLSNIGVLYKDLEDNAKALEYLMKALKISEEINDIEGIGNRTSNIGIVYFNQKKYEKALENYEQALKIAEKLGDKKGIASRAGNIGVVYKFQAELTKDPLAKKNFYDKALINFNKALQISLETGSKDGAAIWLANVGWVYSFSGQYLKGEEYLLKALTLADSLGVWDTKMQIEEVLTNHYNRTGNVEKAFAHYIKYIAARDSINSSENIKKQTRLEGKYEYEKKEALLIADQKQERVLAEEKNRRQKFISAGVAGVLFLVLVFAIFIFRSYRQKQKANVIITRQKEEVEKAKELVDEKQKEILDSIHYAKRIQTALITSEKYIAKNLNRLIKNV